MPIFDFSLLRPVYNLTGLPRSLAERVRNLLARGRLHGRSRVGGSLASGMGADEKPGDPKG